MAPASRPPARVMTFNIGRGAVGRRWGPSPPGATFERLDEVAEAIARLAPEVVALQEVHEGDVPEITRLLAQQHDAPYEGAFAAALPGDHPKLARLADVTRRTPFGVAVLSTAPIASSEAVALPSDGDEERVAQVVRTSLAGRAVTVVAVHLSTKAAPPWAWLVGRPSPQSAQTDAVLDLAGSLGGPVVVLGDWNQSAWRLPHAVRAAGLGHRFTLASDRWAATQAGGHGLDHVLVGGGLRVRYRGVERATVSDHRPVLVGLDVPD